MMAQVREDGDVKKAEEAIEDAKKEVKAKPAANKAFEEESESSSEAEEPDKDDGDPEKELNPRKAAKKLMKAEKRERRKQKKELKVAFKNHTVKLKKQGTVTAGEIRPGVSVKKIY